MTACGREADRHHRRHGVLEPAAEQALTSGEGGIIATDCPEAYKRS